MTKNTKVPLKIIGLLLTVLLLFSSNINNVFSAGNSAPKPTHTPTPTRTVTPSITPTATSTSTPTNTFTATATNTATDTPTSTFTNTPTNTLTNTPTVTATTVPNWLQIMDLNIYCQGCQMTDQWTSAPVGDNVSEFYGYGSYVSPGGQPYYVNPVAAFYGSVKNVGNSSVIVYAVWQDSLATSATDGSWHIYSPGYAISNLTAGTRTYSYSVTLIPNSTWSFSQDGFMGAGNIPGNRTFYVHLSIRPVTDVYTPTPTPTATFTPTSTATATVTPTATPTVGHWYTGNRKDNVYGVKAVISAAAQAPNLISYIDGKGQESGESSWVSIPWPLWVQAGWQYSYGSTRPPVRYIEWNLPHPPPGETKPHDFHFFGNQDWGTSSNYYLIWGGGTTWCVQVDNNPLECFDTEQQYAPIGVQAFSEVQASPLNELNTTFSQVYYFDANGWKLFDQGLWRTDTPYHVDSTQYYEYRNYGP